MPQWSVAPAIAGSSTAADTLAGKKRGRPRKTSEPMEPAELDEPAAKRPTDRFAMRSSRPSVGTAWIPSGGRGTSSGRRDTVGNWRDEIAVEVESREGRRLPGTEGNDGLWAERRANARKRVLVATHALGPRAAIPHEDLLISLHLHAARFFAAHGTLRCPRPWRPRAHGEGPREAEEGEDEEEEEEEEGERQERIREDQKAASDPGYAAALRAYRADLARPAYTQYRRSEMHTALEGSALLALGVLAEEIVAHELALAGFTKAEGRDVVKNGDGDRDGRNGRDGSGEEDDNDKAPNDDAGSDDDDDDDDDDE